MDAEQQEELLNEVSRVNVVHTVNLILPRSELIRGAVEEGSVNIVGALYDVRSGFIDFFDEPNSST